jgi:hypothetical protein
VLSGIGVIPYFEPLHPAVIYRCQLCGVDISKDDYLTLEARRRRAVQERGEYIFCGGCSPHLEEITRKVANEGARLDAEHERAKTAALKQLAQELLAGLNRHQHTPVAADASTPPRPDPAAPPPARPAKRRVAGVHIPPPPGSE